MNFKNKVMKNELSKLTIIAIASFLILWIFAGLAYNESHPTASIWKIVTGSFEYYMETFLLAALRFSLVGTVVFYLIRFMRRFI